MSKTENKDIYYEFQFFINHFKNFLKSEIFIKFILNCDKKDNNTWNNILTSTEIAIIKMNNQCITLEDIIVYNFYADEFYNNVLLKYNGHEDILKKYMLK